MLRRLWKVVPVLASVIAVAIVALRGSSGPSQAQDSDPDLDANKALVEEFVAALNAHDLSLLDAILSEDFAEHNPFVAELPPGPEGFKLVAGGILAAFPDVEIEIGLVLAEGDLVATRHTVTATHQGEFNGVPATGNDVIWTENHLWRIEDGKIVEHWAELNALGLLAQIGALPAPE